MILAPTCPGSTPTNWCVVGSQAGWTQTGRPGLPAGDVSSPPPTTPGLSPSTRLRARRAPTLATTGIVDLNPGVGDILWRGEYQVTSPPAIVHDLVIVGSAVADNVRVNPPSGVVRAWDARTGRLRWSWDLAPPDFVPSPDNTGSAGYALGTPNVWAPMSVDTRARPCLRPDRESVARLLSEATRTWTTTAVRSWRSGLRPDRSSGTTRPCTGTCGILTCRLNPLWSA